MSLEDYCRQLASLKRAPNFPDITRRRAPHKPLLLLAVMEMIGRGQINSHFISITGELTELTALFSAYWRALMPPNQTSSIAFPFSRLNSEPFWELVALPGKQITKEAINDISTVTQLRQLALGANLNEDLFLYLVQPDTRIILRDTLLHACFSNDGFKALLGEIGIEHQAYEYSNKLARRAHHIEEADPAIEYADEVRNQGFRRAIVSCYNHRCALCGVRIITPEGHTAVEAAHIKPWSKFKDDDVRNGIALCRLCHWAFDEGLMSVDDNYGVVTSRQMAAIPNTPGFLMALSSRHIIIPKDRDMWPDSSRLAWHRKHFGLD